jgi:ABC-2 type transport system permease protein
MKKEKSNFFGLSLQLAKAGFKLRNEGSYLGILWYLLNPLLLFGLLFLVFSDRLGNNIPNYPIYLLLGVIMFNFFQNATLESTRSITKEYRGVVRSINFPKEAIIAGIIMKSLFSHAFEIILMIILMVFLGGSFVGIAAYILIVLLFCIFLFGVCLILACLTVFFADLENIWNFAVRLIWLGTPIFYSIGGQTKLFYINLFNPLYYFITLARETVIYGAMPEYWIIAGALFYSFLLLFLSLIMFRNLKNRIAEMV